MPKAYGASKAFGGIFDALDDEIKISATRARTRDDVILDAETVMAALETGEAGGDFTLAEGRLQADMDRQTPAWQAARQTLEQSHGEEWVGQLVRRITGTPATTPLSDDEMDVVLAAAGDAGTGFPGQIADADQAEAYLLGLIDAGDSDALHGRDALRCCAVLSLDHPDVFDRLHGRIQSVVRPLRWKHQLRAAKRSVAGKRAERFEGDLPFVALGCSGEDNYHYYSEQKQGVVTLTPAKLAKEEYLLQLAPKSVWEALYGTEEDGITKVDWKAAAGDLMDDCHERPGFQGVTEKGFGIYVDDKKITANFGNVLVQDGQPVAYAASVTHDTIYTTTNRKIFANAADFIMTDALTAEDGQRLADLVSRLNWAVPSSARLMTGWFGVAPLSGALVWRPHVWLTGPAGAGKSTIIERIVKSLLGDGQVSFGVGTTEAAIRQAKGCNAVPVVIDEMEPEGERDQMRVAAILKLARSASTGEVTARGTAGHRVREFPNLNAYLCASISPALDSSAANGRRFSVLTIEPTKGDSAADAFAALQRDLLALLTPAYRKRFFRRAAANVKSVMATAEAIKLAAVRAGSSPAMGDQVGTLLAGWWCLTHDGVISEAAAADLVKEHEDDFSLNQPRQQTDEEKIAAEFLQVPILARDDHGNMQTWTIGGLLQIACGFPHARYTLSPTNARATLEEWGIRIGEADKVTQLRGATGAVKNPQAATVFVPTQCVPLNQAMSTRFASGGWTTILARAPGGKTSTVHGQARIGSFRTGVISVPYTFFSEHEMAPAEDETDLDDALEEVAAREEEVAVAEWSAANTRVAQARDEKLQAYSATILYRCLLALANACKPPVIMSAHEWAKTIMAANPAWGLGNKAVFDPLAHTLRDLPAIDYPAAPTAIIAAKAANLLGIPASRLQG